MKSIIWSRSDYAVSTSTGLILGTLYYTNSVWWAMKGKNFGHGLKVLIIFTGKTLHKRHVLASESVAFEYLLCEFSRISYQLSSETFELLLNAGQGRVVHGHDSVFDANSHISALQVNGMKRDCKYTLNNPHSRHLQRHLESPCDLGQLGLQPVKLRAVERICELLAMIFNVEPDAAVLDNCCGAL